VDVRQEVHDAIHAGGSFLTKHDRDDAVNPCLVGIGRTLPEGIKEDHRLARSDATMKLSANTI
jgi:hypothetical protein